MPIQVTAYGQFRLMFSNPKIRKIFSARSGFSIPFLPLLLLVIKIDFEFDMAREGAEPNAYEYAVKGSPNASDDDEGTKVELNASITKLLTTQGVRDSNESTNADAEDISAMDTMEYILPTLRVRQEEGSLSQKDYDQLASFTESLLDVLAEADTGTAKQEVQATQEVPATRPADGSSRKSPLDMEGGNRENSPLFGQPFTF